MPGCKRKIIRKRCCNPLKLRVRGKKNKHSTDLRPVTSRICELYTDISLSDYVCNTCNKKIARLCLKLPVQKNQEIDNCAQEQESLSDSGESVCETVISEDYTCDLDISSPVNKKLASCQMSPLIKSRFRSKKYQEKKINEIRDVIFNNEASACRENDNESSIINALKIEYEKDQKRSTKIQILTIVAASNLSVHEVMSKFGCKKNLVQFARKLYKEKGAMSCPNKKTGKKLSDDIVQKVIEFYELDDVVSRQLPGIRDAVKIPDGEGAYKYVQKRLLLGNLLFLYNLFKEKYPEIKIGKTKFIELRPKYCVLSGSPGTLNVCVCTIHQNPKLMMLGGKLKDLTLNSECPLADCNDCLQLLVCDINNADCMLGICNDCPGTHILKSRLEQVFQENYIDEIKYKRWQVVDRCNIDTICEKSEDFIETFIMSLEKLLPHTFIAKKQKQFLEKEKEELKDGEIIIIVDWSESYEPTIQDAAQHYHWSKQSSSLHISVVYYRDRDSKKLCHFSHVAISDDKTHNTARFYLIQKKMLARIKQKIKFEITKVKYFSDGSAAQYKNRKSFLNVLLHKEDFGIEAEWHFFATSHGKGPCDGIGGTIKRAAQRASIQRPYDKQIITPLDFYEYVCTLPSMHLVDYITEKENKVQERALNRRFSQAKAIAGTQGFHCILPYLSDRIEVRRFSSSPDSSTYYIR